MLVDWHWCSCWLVRGIERAHRLPAKATCPAPPVLTHHLGNHCPNISKLPKYLKIAQISVKYQTSPYLGKFYHAQNTCPAPPTTVLVDYLGNHCPNIQNISKLPKYSKIPNLGLSRVMPCPPQPHLPSSG